jgi:hypothetical protein
LSVSVVATIKALPELLILANLFTVVPVVPELVILTATNPGKVGAGAAKADPVIKTQLRISMNERIIKMTYWLNNFKEDD